jgi:RNA polymerase sigma factor (TIGR02999 family)
MSNPSPGPSAGLRNGAEAAKTARHASALAACLALGEDPWTEQLCAPGASRTPLPRGSAATASSAAGIDALVQRTNAGEREAWNLLIASAYPELLRLAAALRYLDQPQVEPAALVHECYLRLSSARGLRVDSLRHLLALCARTMRQIISNQRRERCAGKRGGGIAADPLHELDGFEAWDVATRVDVDRGMRELSRVDPRLARIVHCRTFCGMTESETASSLGLSLRSVQRMWRDARRELHLNLCIRNACEQCERISSGRRTADDASGHRQSPEGQATASVRSASCDAARV